MIFLDFTCATTMNGESFLAFLGMVQSKCSHSSELDYWLAYWFESRIDIYCICFDFYKKGNVVRQLEKHYVEGLTDVL